MKKLFRIVFMSLILAIVLYAIFIQFTMEVKMKNFETNNLLPKRGRVDFTPAMLFEMQWMISDRKKRINSCAYYEFCKPYDHKIYGSQSTGYYYVYVTHTRQELDSLTRCSCPDELPE